MGVWRREPQTMDEISWNGDGEKDIPESWGSLKKCVKARNDGALLGTPE